MKQQLTKLEMLWIRACKSKEPEKRLVSLYRRFYTRSSSNEEELRAISALLAGLCDKHFPISITYFLQCSQHYCNRGRTFQETAFSTIRRRIRYQNSSALVQTTDFIPPKRFR